MKRVSPIQRIFSVPKMRKHWWIAESLVDELSYPGPSQPLARGLVRRTRMFDGPLASKNIDPGAWASLRWRITISGRCDPANE